MHRAALPVPSDKSFCSAGCLMRSSFLLLNAGHLLHLENARALATGLADFFERHPINRP